MIRTTVCMFLREDDAIDSAVRGGTATTFLNCGPEGAAKEVPAAG